MTNKELEVLILQMEDMNAPEQDIADVVSAHEREQVGSVANLEWEQKEEEAKNTRKENRKKKREERKKEKAPQEDVPAEPTSPASGGESSTTVLTQEDIDLALGEFRVQGEDYMGIQFSKDLETERLLAQDSKSYLDEFDEKLDLTSAAKGTEEQWSSASRHPNFVKMYEDIFNKVRNAEGFLGDKVTGGWGNNGDNWLNPSDLPEGEEGDRIFLNYIGVGAVQQGQMGDHGLRKNGHQGYYGATPEYSAMLDEVYYLQSMHEVANVYAAQMPGLNVEDMNPAEIISMYHSGAWKAKREVDERGDLTFDVEYNLEIHNTLANQELERDLADHMGTVMVPFEQASRTQSFELQQVLSQKYVTLAYDDPDISRLMKKADKKTQKQAKAEMDGFLKKFVEENPGVTIFNEAGEVINDDLLSQWETFTDEIYQENMVEAHDLIDVFVSDRIMGNDLKGIAIDPEWETFVTEYTSGFDTKAAEFGQKFIESFQPSRGEVGEEFGVWDNALLEVVANKLNENGFGSLTAPDKKNYIELTLDGIIDQAKKEGAEFSVEDEAKLRHEFFGFFYDRLLTEETGQLDASGNPIQRASAFALRDVARQCLDFYEEQKEEYIRLMVAKKKGLGLLKMRGYDDYEDFIRTEFDSWTYNSRGGRVEGFEDGFPKELQLLKQYAEDVLESPEKSHDMKYGEFWSGVFSRRGYKYIPFVGGFVDMNDQFKIMDIANKPKEERTESERMLLAMTSVKQQSDGMVGEISHWYNGGQIAGDMIPFVGEFIATGPAFRSAKTSFQVAVRGQMLTRLNKIKDVGKFGLLKPTTGTLVLDKSVNGLSTLFAIGAQTTFNPQRIGKTAFEHMTPEMTYSFSTEADSLISHLDVITGLDDEGIEMGLGGRMGTAEAWIKSFGVNYAEMFSENLGRYLPGMSTRARKLLVKEGGLLDDVLNKEVWKRLTLGHGLRKFGLDNLDDFYRFSRKHAGWNGFMGESFEEMVNFPLQNIVMGDRPVLQGIFKYDQFGNNLGLDTDGLTDMGIGIGSISLFGGGGGAVMGRFGPKQKTYYVNFTRFTDWNAAKAYAEKLKSTGKFDANLDIEIRHDYAAYDEMAKMLEENGLDPSQIKTVSGNSATGSIIPAEVEVLDRVKDPKDRETLIETSEELEKLENEKNSLDKSDMSNKDKAKRRKGIQNRIDALNAKKSSIVAPIRKKIMERRAKKQHKETLRKVQNIVSKIPGLSRKLKFTTVRTKAEARALFLKNRFGLEEEVVTKTNKSGSTTKTTTYYNINEDGSRGKKSDIKKDQISAAVTEAEQAHGYINEGGKGNPNEIIIHEDAAIHAAPGEDAPSGANVSGHEFLHYYLQKTFQDSPELSIAVSRAFRGYVQGIDPATIRDSEFRNRLVGYMDKGEAVVAEESLTLFLDAIAGGHINYNETAMEKLGIIIKRIAHRLGFKVKFKTGKDVYNFLIEFQESIEREEFSEGLISSMTSGIEIDGQILEEAESIESKIDADLETYNKLAKDLGQKEVDRKTYREIAMSIPGYKFSKPSTTEQAEIDKLGRNKDGSDMTKEQWDNEGSIAAYDALVEKGKIIPMITKGMNFPVYGKPKEVFVEDVLYGPSGGVVGTILRFNPEEEIDKATGKFGLSGWINYQLNLRKIQILDAYKSKQAQSLDETLGSEGTQSRADQLVAPEDTRITDFESRDLSLETGEGEMVEAEKLIQIAEELDIDMETMNEVVDILFPINETTNTRSLPETLNVNDFGDYKSLKPLIGGAATETRVDKDGNVILDKKGNPKQFKVTSVKTVQPTGPYFELLDKIAKEIYGVSAKKILTDSNLTTAERASAQAAIKEKAEAHINLVIPEGDTASVTSTGAANTSYGVYYQGGGRGEYAKGATAAGKPTQAKRGDITVQEILTDIGMREDGTFDSSSAAKGFDPMIRTHVLMSTVAIANQAIRSSNEQFGVIPEKVAAKLGDGRSQQLFSKSSVPEHLRDAYNQKYAELIVAVSGTNPGSLKSVTRAVESVFTKEDGFKPGNIKTLATVIFSRIKQYNEISKKHKLDTGELINFDKSLAEYLSEQKELETFELSLQKTVEAHYKKNGKKYPTYKKGKNKGKKIPLGHTLLEEGDIIKHRAMIPAIAEKLISNGVAIEEVAEIMLSLRGMYAGASVIGDGRYIPDGKGGIMPDPNWDGYSRNKDGSIKTDKKGNPKFSTNRKQVTNGMPDYLSILKTIPGLENLQNINPETGKPSQAYYLNGVKIKSTSFTDKVEAFMKEQKADADATFKGRTSQAEGFRDTVETILDAYWEEVNSSASNVTLVDFAAVITMMGSGMESILRKSAPAEYKMVGIEEVIAEGKRQGKSMKDIARYEHAISQVDVANKILHSYTTNGNLDPSVWEGFKVAIISVEMDDVMKEIGMNTRSPLDGKPRYFNENSFGHPAIKPLQSIDPKKKGTPQEFVGKDFVAAMEAVKSGSLKDAQLLSAAYRGIKLSKPSQPKGASIWDFDDTLAHTTSDVLFTAPDGTKGKLTAEEFAKQGANLLEQGYIFDFSEFNKVTEGRPGPLFDKALERAKKFGTENQFILTARAPEAQVAIHEFLKGVGLDIPIENIKGLGNSTGQAKADWIAQNIVAQGYNDVYFADDALANVDAVKTMFDLFDVKGKVEQAKIKFSKPGGKKISDLIEENVDLSEGINIALEETQGVDRKKTFSRAKARQRGKNKGRFKFFIPPSAEDFAGLLYPLLGKGKQGEQHHAWFKKNLFDPYSKGIRALRASQQAIAEQKRALKTPKSLLRKNSAVPEFTNEQAVRVYNWVRQGHEVPGLSQADLKKLVDHVESNTQLREYADAIDSIAQQAGGILPPASHWLSGSINTDLIDSTESMRDTMLQDWINNKDAIFTPEVLNKLEAIFGSNYREALEDMLYRMETGSSRSVGSDRLMNNFVNWISGSVGATMFFNARSATLQMISNINFVNWSDNNPLKAAAAFANQPQYWKDVAMIFNSPFLKQRRGGIQTDVNAAELMKELQGSGKPVQAAVAYLLQLGFTPTQIADSFAIATGGATMYRNRVNTYISQGMTQSEAESQAFEDMMEIAEETQQSTRPDRISQQQASPLGKLILAFQNTPMQYARLMKKAGQDLINGRGDAKTNISKILYYGFVQNIIFYGMQTALFSIMFGDDDEEDDKLDQKTGRVINGMMDSILRGGGIGGAVVSTLKNMILEFMEQEAKDDDGKFFTEPDHAYTVIEALNLSPPIGIKARKMYSSLQTWEFNKDVIESMDKADIDNPIHDAWTGGVEAITNAPVHRIYNKLMNVREAMNSDHETYKRVAMLLGWSRWNFGIRNSEVLSAKQELKEIKAQEKEEKKEQKKKEKEAEREAENEAIIQSHVEEQEEEREKGTDEKDIRCAAVKRNGERCSNKVLPGEKHCTIHVEVPQSTKEVQCSHVKGNGKQCKMKTKNKSGKCYYHD